MKLDRNINKGGRGKYALIKLRVATPTPLRALNLNSIVGNDSIDYGDTPDTEFFVIRLKDKYAASALLAYGSAAYQDDPEYADEIFGLAERAAAHPNSRRPD